MLVTKDRAGRELILRKILQRVLLPLPEPDEVEGIFQQDPLSMTVGEADVDRPAVTPDQETPRIIGARIRRAWDAGQIRWRRDRTRRRPVGPQPVDPDGVEED